MMARTKLFITGEELADFEARHGNIKEYHKIPGVQHKKMLVIGDGTTGKTCALITYAFFNFENLSNC